MDKIPVFLVTGFLGSGKTTLIKRVIDHFQGNERVGIVQNEFAPSNFDGKELRRLTNSDFELLEINNGSVFCVCLLEDFKGSLKKFVETCHPDMLIIEASGLSDPVALGQIFDDPVLGERLFYAGSVCVVDSKNFLSLSKLMLRITHQLMIADVVILNKIDLNENYEDVQESIEAINPFCRKFFAAYCEVNIDEIFNFLPAELKIQKKDRKSPANAQKPQIQSVVLKSVKPLQLELIDDFLKEVIPLTFRVKGYIKTDDAVVVVQSSFGEVHKEKISQSLRQTELILMGEGIHPRMIREIYSKYCLV